MSETTQATAGDRELSTYAFNEYGADAKLYNGIHDLESEIARLRALATKDGEAYAYLAEQHARLTAENAAMRYKATAWDELSRELGTIMMDTCARCGKPWPHPSILGAHRAICHSCAKKTERENAAMREALEVFAEVPAVVLETQDGDTDVSLRVGARASWSIRLEAFLTARALTRKEAQ